MPPPPVDGVLAGAGDRCPPGPNAAATSPIDLLSAAQMKLLWEVAPTSHQNSEYRVLQTSPHLRETKGGFGDYVFRRPLLPASRPAASSSLASSESSSSESSSSEFHIIARGNSSPASRELFVKVVHKRTVRSEEHLASLAREIEIFSRLSHCPNVLKLMDVVVTPSSVYIVTEKCELSVAQYAIGSSPVRVTPFSTRNIVAGAMNALVHLHRLGFCHLRLHPGAILINTNDLIPASSIHPFNVRLSFFEDAQKLAAPDDSSVVPFFGQTGVPGYRSSEAIIGTVPYDGPSADNYSMGCIALELILGLKTFKKAWLDVQDRVRNRGDSSEEMQSAWVEELEELELAADHEIRPKRFLMQPSTLEEFATDYVPAMLEQERKSIERSGALEFLSTTLFVNPADRPTAEELLFSPWLSHRTRSDEQQQPGDQESQGLCRVGRRA